METFRPSSIPMSIDAKSASMTHKNCVERRLSMNFAAKALHSIKCICEATYDNLSLWSPRNLQIVCCILTAAFRFIGPASRNALQLTLGRRASRGPFGVERRQLNPPIRKCAQIRRRKIR